MLNARTQCIPLSRLCPSDCITGFNREAGLVTLLKHCWPNKARVSSQSYKTNAFPKCLPSFLTAPAHDPPIQTNTHTDDFEAIINTPLTPHTSITMDTNSREGGLFNFEGKTVQGFQTAVSRV